MSRIQENSEEDLVEDQFEQPELLDTLSKLSLMAFMKELVRRIRVTYNEVVDEIRGNNEDPTKKIEQVTQTSPKTKEYPIKDITEEPPKGYH